VQLSRPSDRGSDRILASTNLSGGKYISRYLDPVMEVQGLAEFDSNGTGML